MTEYVLGFAFNEDKSYVVLIKKEKPEFQKDKLNGLGGKIEAGEEPIEAMVREFKEESGIYIDELDWNKQCVLSGSNFIIHVYNTFNDKVLDAETMEEEEVFVFPISLDLFRDYGLSNVPWLIGMALDDDSNRFCPTITYED